MKKIARLISLWLGLLINVSTCLAATSAPYQQPTTAEKMAKVRAAKAQKKVDREVDRLKPVAGASLRATPADYAAPVDKVAKGPNGETVHTGERGAKFYINKNGNKTYLSSNQ